MSDLARIQELEQALTQAQHRLTTEREAHTEARNRAARQQQFIKLLKRTASDFNRVAHPDDALRQALVEVCIYTGWPLGHVYRLSDSGEELVPTDVWNAQEERFSVFRQVTEATTLPIGSGLPGRVAQTRRALWIANVHEDVNFPRARAVADLGVRAAFGFPVLCDDRVVVVLEFFSTSVLAPDDQLLDMLAHVGELLGRVFERQRTQQERVARDVAEASSQAKSQFLATMSHELRTPLTAIIGYTELLEEECRAEDPQSPWLPDLVRVASAAHHLLALINDVLDLSKIEAGRMELYLEPFAVDALLTDVEATLRPMVERKGNRLVVVPPPPPCRMRSDLTKVRQCLFNLLSNANKFTDGGSVRLEVSRAADFVVFNVHDSGLGMSPDQLSRLFQPFSQAESSTQRKFGGSGLGLAITRRFCDMLGGSITVVSSPGTGSSFTMRLPLETAGGANVSTEPLRSPSMETSAVATVLVIDDDAAVRALVERSLTREGYRVVTAANGETGLQLARELRPEVITLDIVMPHTDGWMVLTELKSDPALQEIPVIVLTLLDEKNLGYALGAADYLSKPVDRGRLVGLVRKYSQGASGNNSILVVDDDAAVRDLLRRVLEAESFTVAEASHGRDALQRVAQALPRLILLDLMMPVMDGFQFLEALRLNPDWAKIPIVVLTSMDLTDADRRRLDGSVQRVLTKGAATVERVLTEVLATVRGITSPQVGNTVT